MNKFAYLSGAFLLFAAPLASSSPGAVTAKGPNSTWTFQWPWSTNSKQDIPIPGSSFTPDVTIFSPRCLWGVMRLSSKFDTTCFQNSKSLYFSAPGQVCSPRCLDTTISMSQYMVEKCGLQWPRADQPVGYNHKDVVYLSWADRSLSELVCKGPGGDWNQPGQCYSAIFTAETARETDALTRGELKKEYVCNACTQEWTKRVSAGKYHISPILYYGHIPDTVRLASWISEKCGYNMAPL
ncbi:hypothetical protein IWW37_004108 [Coemansia sp. RSA 2050]|nr:hypothetical protein IWW37_004108 [Coemansia sp. RSA 2050]KAJ2731945.1 hypothetical protein IW152_004158 [Coemansia sp. BCRC 34962]